MRGAWLVMVAVGIACAARPPRAPAGSAFACDAGAAAVTRTTVRGIEAWCEDDRGLRRGDGGLEWVHAENRVQPYWRQSYTGYMQGAAGIGSLFIRLAAHDRRLAWKVRLPDNPLPIV